MPETIIVKEVNEGTNGWYEVSLEDGRKASTKDKRLADAAFATRGQEIEAELGTSTNGKFTNIYLNGITGVETNGGPRPARGRSTGGSAPRGKSPEEQDRIARQWSYGRAVELLATSSTEFTLPLNDATKKALTETADWLLAQTK